MSKNVHKICSHDCVPFYVGIVSFWGRPRSESVISRSPASGRSRVDCRRTYHIKLFVTIVRTTEI
eukprot:scaffold69917_cov59-Attheya_sp.AAC.3